MRSVAFCVPVMGRSDDVKQTLLHNVNVVKSFNNLAKIYINCFDVDSSLQEWVFSEFDEDIKNGYLVFNRCEPLKYWHFSWAKNSFNYFIKEDYYSSLDGDNFLSLEEVEEIFNIINSYSQVVFHGFSGSWGDGTSGRVTLPTMLYKKYGYLNEILPRQVDEIGLLANVIKNEKNIPYISYEGVNIFVQSSHLKKWKELDGIVVNNIQIKKNISLKPINPRGEDYVKKDNILSFYQKFNSAYTYAKISSKSSSYNFFKKQLDDAVVNLAVEQVNSILPKCFDFKTLPILSEAITIYAVIKNDFIFINEWLRYYRNIGVKRFIIVDDKSDSDLSEYIKGDDIFIFKPLIGNFKICKVLWLNLLLKSFQKQDSWFVTVDSDEFISLDGISNSLTEFCEKLDKNKQRFASGLLVDMLPSKNYSLSNLNAELFIEQYDHFYHRPFLYNKEYTEIKSIEWAFGNHWSYSFQLDARWRFFQTIDSLRKFPLVKYVYNIELNQGFHGLKIDGKNVSSNWAFKRSEFILPVKHYKFVSLFENILQNKKFDSYHERTEKNLNRIVNKNLLDLKSEIDRSPFVQKFSISKFQSIFFKKIGFYRILGNNLPNLHSNDQTISNLNFIILQESEFKNVDKYFVLNRLVDPNQKKEIKELLMINNVKFYDIPFDYSDYIKIGYDLGRLPDPDFWFRINKPWEKTCAHVAIRESKNRYLMNNNGARNFCLDVGRKVYEWVLPWDGNCFLSDNQFDKLKSRIDELKKDKYKYKYIAVPMERVIDNDLISNESISENHTEEPQLAFHQSSIESFNIDRVYGNQPKVELFKRLKFKGIWDDWKRLYPWEELKVLESQEANQVCKASNVFRLFSGNQVAAKDASNRAAVRFNSIVEYIDKVEINYISEFSANISVGKTMDSVLKNHFNVNRYQYIVDSDLTSDALIKLYYKESNFDFKFYVFNYLIKIYLLNGNIDLLDKIKELLFLDQNMSLGVDFLTNRDVKYIIYELMCLIFSYVTKNYKDLISHKVQLIMLFYSLINYRVVNKIDFESDVIFVYYFRLTNNILSDFIGYELYSNLQEIIPDFQVESKF